ncbi:MAG TPA: hypothetical protein VMV69_07040 [Pirellulales bacterium]|nr:hypothetical protein [Pirellulales bacterium]
MKWIFGSVNICGLRRVRYNTTHGRDVVAAQANWPPGVNGTESTKSIPYSRQRLDAALPE